MEEIIKKPSILKPWEKYYNPELINKDIQGVLLYEALLESCEAHKDIIALDYYSRQITYGELIEKVNLYAASFHKLGINKGDVISFVTVSIPESIYAIYGLNKIGAICNFIDVRTDSPHILEYVLKAKSKAVVILDIAYEKISSRLDELEVDKVIIQSAFDSMTLLKSLFLKTCKAHRVSINDNRVIKNRDFEKQGKGCSVDAVIYEKDMPAVITRTGGTTGVSKGVILTNDNLNAVYRNFRDVVGDASGDSLLNFLPLGASYGIACGIHMALCMSVRNILVPKFSPEEFADLILDKKPNHIIGVPIFYENMMNSKRMANADLSFIKTMAAGGDSANAGFEKKLREFTRERGIVYPLAQGYGMSETSSACAFGVRDIHKDGSAGLPCIHSTISIFEPGTDRELSLGERGEICISGPTVMKEYLDEPEETENAIWIHSDGKRWVHSGDLGYIDEDGFLFITGRIKRSIIRFDGHKVYPVQIESAIEKSEHVKTCAVIAIEDREHEQGELPLAIVEPMSVQDLDSNELRKEIIKLCKENLEERGQPIDVVVVDKMPLTRNSKKDIRALEEKFRDYNYIK